MAASASAVSRYAAALHRRTHRVTTALAYAALEWVLIALLLINGLLAYATERFAAYFGLTPPCLLCSRVDRLFEAEDGDEAAGGARWLRGVLCGDHAAEISGMGYCLHHCRLADAGDMCESCLSSSKKERRTEDKGAVVCSCCKALVEISSHELADTKEDSVHKKTAEEEDDDQGYVLLGQEDREEDEEEQEEAGQQQHQHEEEGQEEQGEKVAAVEDDSLGAMAWGKEIAREDDRLVPVVALVEMTIADDPGMHPDAGEGEGGMNHVGDNRDSDDLDMEVVLEEKRMLASSVATAAVIENESAAAIPRAATAVSSSDPDEKSIPLDDEVVLEDTVAIRDSRAEEEDIVVPQGNSSLASQAVPEDGNRSAEMETNCEVSIGSEICEREQDDHIVPFQKPVALVEPFTSLAYADYRPFLLETLHERAPTEQEASEAEQEEVTFSQRLEHLPNEQSEPEEDKAPETETPTCSFATQNSDRKFLLERKRSMSLSLDGSVSSEIECGEPSTIEQLKSTLQAERKALSAMYAELEEERNAAAIATNQTMAMINRLQEEKAAMQMEALQYQRMMEEQSEYDQEALQLLNELVSKKEREKQELERELELCKQKLLHYEDKERRRMASFKDIVHSPNGNGSSVSSSGEDSDEHSDDYCELGESPNGGNLQSSSDAALSPRTDQENTGHLAALDDSLTYFEMERLSILEELKTLEKRLFTLEDDDINDTDAAAGHSSDDYEMSAEGLHSMENGPITGDKAKFEGRSSIRRGKSLLPLFDAAGDENCDRISSARVGDVEADDSTKPVSVFAKEQERLLIIEEVDHVYERLQALEADKESLRHCIKSLKKGDKGMYLLQEILQHLRELRNVELHVKNAGDALAANSA